MTSPFKTSYLKGELQPTGKDWVMARVDPKYTSFSPWLLGKILNGTFHPARISNQGNLHLPYYPCTGIDFTEWRHATEEEVKEGNQNDPFYGNPQVIERISTSGV